MSISNSLLHINLDKQWLCLENGNLKVLNKEKGLLRLFNLSYIVNYIRAKLNKRDLRIQSVSLHILSKFNTAIRRKNLSRAKFYLILFSKISSIENLNQKNREKFNKQFIKIKSCYDKKIEEIAEKEFEKFQIKKLNPELIEQIGKLTEKGLNDQLEKLEANFKLMTKQKKEELKMTVGQIISHKEKICQFLSSLKDQRFGHLSKKETENISGYSFYRNKKAVIMHIPNSKLAKGSEKSFKLGIDLLSGELIGFGRSRTNVLNNEEVFEVDKIVCQRCLGNPYLIPYYGFAEYRIINGVIIKLGFMKLCALGDASSLRGKKLSRKEILRYTYCIAKGILALYLVHLTHNDLKLENLLLTGDPNIPMVISDYGCAVNWEGRANQRLDVFGTPASMAPERTKEKEFSFEEHHRGDLYSLGTILYSLIKGKEVPWVAGLNPIAILNSLDISTEKSFVDSLASELDPNDSLQELCRSLLEYNSWKRPSIDKVIAELEKNS